MGATREIRAARWATAGLIALAAAFGLGLLVRVAAGDGPLGIDSWWREIARAAPQGLLLDVSRVLDIVGGGRFATLWVPLGIILLLILLRRPWSALAFSVASFASTGLVQLAKAAFARLRPDDILIDISSAAYPGSSQMRV